MRAECFRSILLIKMYEESVTTTSRYKLNCTFSSYERNNLFLSLQIARIINWQYKTTVERRYNHQRQSTETTILFEFGNSFPRAVSEISSTFHFSTFYLNNLSSIQFGTDPNKFHLASSPFFFLEITLFHLEQLIKR